MNSRNSDKRQGSGDEEKCPEHSGDSYRTIFEHSPIGFVVADPERQIVDANLSVCRFLGQSREELLNRPITDLLDPAHAWRISSVLETLSATSALPQQTWLFRRKDGSPIEGEVRIIALSDASFVGFIHDLSGQQAIDVGLRKLAAIVESSDDAIISKDLDGIITSWNPGAEKMFGYTENEMMGTSIRRLIPPDLQNEETRILEKLRKGERVQHHDTKRVTKDGRVIEVSISTSPIRDGDGRFVGASKIVRDISPLIRRERDIARMTHLYAALSQVNQAIVMERSRSSLFQKVCRVLIEQGGFEMSWIGWHDPETHRLIPVAVWGDDTGYLTSINIYADERPEGRGPSGIAFRSAQPYICNDIQNDPSTLPWRDEIKHRGFLSSAVFPIRENDTVVATLTVYANQQDYFKDKEIALLLEAAGDLSFALDSFSREEERQKAELIAESEMQFSYMMMESMPGVLYFYNEQGQFLRWNKNFEIVTGYSGNEIARMTPLDFFSTEDKPRLIEKIGEVFTIGESSVEAHLQSKDGHFTPYFFTGRRVEFKGETCLVGVGIDISKRKKTEQALRELNETLENKVADRTSELKSAMVRAEAADKLKSAFLATMSHELRTPLNSIIGFTGILLQNLAGPLNDEQTKQLNMVRGSARHLLELINDVLDISKIEANQLEVREEPFDLRQSVEHLLALVQPLAQKKGLILHANLAPEIGEMLSDRRRIEQILLNLLNNALKFTEHGKVTLTIFHVDDFRPAPNAPVRPTIRFQVEDTGIGIKEHDLETLFQPFRQVESGLTRQHEGTGLGLAICRRLSSLLGGEITVRSEWTKGSVFTVTLPMKLRISP